MQIKASFGVPRQRGSLGGEEGDKKELTHEITTELESMSMESEKGLKRKGVEKGEKGCGTGEIEGDIVKEEGDKKCQGRYYSGKGEN